MSEAQLQEEGRAYTVLIAEDEKPLAEAIAATLDTEGLETIIARDGDRALELIRKLRPDLVLLDVMMPSRSGIEVCATLKTDPVTSSIPVILVTAAAEEADRAVGLAAGADEYLTKPFSPTELISLVREALSGELAGPRAHRRDFSEMPPDQLVVYARELNELFEQERLERQELEEAHRRLAERDRLKAEFLGVVTHELMTPFSSIGLALEVLQRESEGADPELKGALDELATEIADLHRLIGGVVKFAELVSKRRPPQMGDISLDQVVQWALQPVAVLAQGREIDFRVLVPPDLPQVHADPELLGEAVFQMGHNAVKFNLPGGEAQVRAFVTGKWMVIQVTDSGVGLSAEQMAKLGQPFEQSADALRRGQEGLGIGWTFVRYVAEVHDGWTHVDSPGVNQGSTFSLGILLAEQAEPTPDAPEEAEE